MSPSWIWLREEALADSYGEFYTSFDWQDGETELRICADSDYVLFLNGQFVESDQYKDFPGHKVYDRFSVTPYLHAGKNHVAILVWYYGVSNFSYYPGAAGLWFEISNAGICIAASGEQTLSRRSPAYPCGARKLITNQLGFSFSYHADREDDWKTGNLCGFSKSKADDRTAPLIERPVKKLKIGNRAESCLIRKEGNRLLFDLGQEEVGYLTLSVYSDVPQKLTVSWGEHVTDGWVRRRIKSRDFSADIFVGAGETCYTNYFRRLGARYLELVSETDAKVRTLTLFPCFYPLQRVDVRFGNALTDRIYATAVRTLELCMHDHYEDCPWREQAMYTMDSRNQMLCGYYAFREYSFPRACLWLMSRDDRADGLLSICTPTREDLTIPSFSLHYFVSVYEYTVHSGDLTLAKEILPKLDSVLTTFLSRMRNGLVPTFAGKEHWNFYEWRDGLDGYEKDEHEDAALNCLLLIALDRMQRLCDLLQVGKDYQKIIKTLQNRVFDAFYDAEKGLFRNRADVPVYSELVNSLAILSGVATKDIAKKIAAKLARKSEMMPVSLSMTCFKYDAMLATDKNAYRKPVLEDIKRIYKPMLDAGATTFWETEKGEADFGGAGSLCHGWSAMPVYYFHTLSADKP